MHQRRFERLYLPTTPDGEPRLVEIACWSHARRQLYEVHHETASPIALEALQRIAALFAIEGAICGQSPDRRAAARAEHAAPLLEQLKAFLETSLKRKREPMTAYRRGLAYGMVLCVS